MTRPLDSLPSKFDYAVTMPRWQVAGQSSDAIAERDRRDFEESLRVQAARLNTRLNTTQTRRAN